MTFPESIYDQQACVVPAIDIQEIRLEDLGERVLRATCTVNGIKAKRVTQDIYGRPVNPVPVWSLKDRIVSDWFAILLEEKYQQVTKDQTFVIH